MNRTAIDPSIAIDRVPRVSGDEPFIDAILNGFDMCSPRERG